MVAMIDAVMTSKVIKIDIGQTVETGDSIDKIEVDQGINKIIRGGNVRCTTRTYQN